MRQKGFIKYFVIIGVIFGIVFLSQQVHILDKGKNSAFANDAVQQAEAYVAKGSGWVMDKVFPSISGEVQKRGEMVTEGINDQKEKVSENISGKISNYFSGVTESVLHPGDPQNCPPQTQSSQ